MWSRPRLLCFLYKQLFCAGVGPPRHTQCATSPVCTILRVVGPLGRGRRDPGPAMRGPAPGAEVALGKPSLLRLSSLADFKPVSSDRPRTTSAVPTPTFFDRGGLGPGGPKGAPRATSSNSVFQVTSAPGAGTPLPLNPGSRAGGDYNPGSRELGENTTWQ